MQKFLDKKYALAWRIYPFLTLIIIHTLILCVFCGSIVYAGNLYKSMNILLTWSGDLLNLGPAIYAVINSHPNNHISFYITTTKKILLPKFIKHFDKISVLNVKFYFEVHKTKHLDFKTLYYDVPYDAYIRLVFPNAHPELDRFLYLDGDAIVVNNIDDLYNYEFKNKSAVAVKDRCNPCEGFEDYFNSGVLLFNNWKYVREKTLEKANDYLKWLSANKNEWFNDQTPLNKVFEHSKVIFPMEYNEFNMSRFGANTKIVHFYDAPCKPYNYDCDIETPPYKLWRCFYKAYENHPNLWREKRNISICTNKLRMQKAGDDLKIETI